jgi:hypothetical protein
LVTVEDLLRARRANARRAGALGVRDQAPRHAVREPLPSDDSYAVLPNHLRGAKALDQRRTREASDEVLEPTPNKDRNW